MCLYDIWQEMKVNWATSPGSQSKVDTSSECLFLIASKFYHTRVTVVSTLIVSCIWVVYKALKENSLQSQCKK